MDANSIIAQLVAVANGQVKHVYNGLCPDAVEGHNTRDDECPACRALIAADNAAPI